MNPRTGIYLFRMLTESWLMVINLLVIYLAHPAHRTTQVRNGTVIASITGTGWNLDSRH